MGDEGKITEVIVKTAPFDPRFPYTNQAKNCWSNYTDFQRCRNFHDGDEEPCMYFKKVFTSLCPKEWVDRWNDQVDNGCFAGRIK